MSVPQLLRAEERDALITAQLEQSILATLPLILGNKHMQKALPYIPVLTRTLYYGHSVLFSQGRQSVGEEYCYMKSAASISVTINEKLLKETNFISKNSNELEQWLSIDSRHSSSLTLQILPCSPCLA